jgi:hypothetical protein
LNTNRPGRAGRLNWKTIPWYVLIFPIYPILALLGHNITEVSPVVAVAPLTISIVSAGILLLVFHALVRDWQRAALAVTVIVVLFFLYGHIYSYLKGINFSGFYLFRHRSLGIIWLILAVLGIWWAWRTKSNLHSLTLGLNVTGVVLFLLPVIQIGMGLWIQQNAWREASQPSLSAALPEGTALPLQEKPDIYYIILDSYGRADRLQELYGYDNSEFLNSLERMGFTIANCSQTNYNQTELSLASSLNFNYLEELGKSFIKGNTDRSPLWPLIKNSALRKFLESQGYKTIAFATGYGWTEIDNADIYLSPQTGAWELNSFQYMLIQTTAGRILLDAEQLRLPNTPDDLIRRRTQFALEKLQVIPSISGPKLIFAHLLVPHSFVFGPNGEAVAFDVSTMTPEIFKKGYLDSITFINKQIENIVATIIANSATPPIIIIQGDHGPAGAAPLDRMSILNAYYLPGHENQPYNTISPVNSFRMVLDEYFGLKIPLLPDISHYSTYQDPYNSFVVENECSK